MKNFIISSMSVFVSFFSICQEVLWIDTFDDPSNWIAGGPVGANPPEYGWSIGTATNSWFGNFQPNMNTSGSFARFKNGTPDTYESDGAFTFTFNGTIDLSNYNNLMLQFEQYGARFITLQAVQISLDGTTWITVIDNNDIPPLTSDGGSIYPHPMTRTVNLTPFLNGPTNAIMIRLFWDGAPSGPNMNYIDYGWYVDDIRILSVPDHWLQLSNPLHLLGDNQFKYTKIPSSQISTNHQLNFTANIKNQGTQSQNTTLQVNTVGYSQNSAAQNLTSLQEEGFSINAPNGFTIPSSLGTYTFNYSAQSGNPLYNPSEALGTTAIEVSDYIMATDSYDGTAASMTGSFTGWSASSGDQGIGTQYEIFNPASLQRVHVGIANVSAANQAQYVGNEFYVQVWKYDVNGELGYAGISELYILELGNFGNIIEINLEDPVTVNPGDIIVPIVMFFESAPVPIAFAGESLQGTTLGVAGGDLVSLAGGNGVMVSTPVVRLDFQVAPELSSNITQPTCANSCNGNISVTATGEGASITPLTYQWFANGQPINGANGSSLTNVCAGNYSVVVTNANGISSSQQFTIQSPSALAVWVGVLPTTCNELADGQFTANVSGGTPPYSYAWSTGEELSTLSGLSNGFQAGLVVTDANSCQTDAGVQTMTANTVDFGLAFVANPTAGTSPLNVIFDNQTPNLSAYDFHWDFGDGLSENNNASFVTHIYSFDGLWDVTLTATDAQGCIDQLVKPGYVFTTGGVSCTHSATIQQASPLTGCPEDNLLLTCNTSPTFTYQWLRNGSPVAGANQSSFFPTQSGSYTVRITENNCPVVSSAVQVTIHPTPATPQITGSGTIDACTGGTLTLTATAGYASYNWSNGGQSQATQVSSSGDYTVTVTNAQGCSATSLPYTVNASLMDIPTVCIVGYDDVTNSNRVIWENPVTEGIDSFYVYRETNIANQYAKIGAVAFEDLSVFTDVTANPAVQAYRYKLSVLDTCGTESALSGLHKTIHLTINQGVGQTWNLIWSHYEGIEFGSYNIYRGTNQNDLTLLTTIASNLSSYTDLTPPAGLLYYQIEVVNEDGCDPTRSFSSSKSNIVNNSEPVSGIAEQSNWSVSLYPNPANDYVTLTLHGQVNTNSLEIFDVQGRLLHSDKLTAQSTVLDVQQYQRGMYIIRVSTEKGQHELRFVKQ
jgi:hypothetical protein